MIHAIFSSLTPVAGLSVSFADKEAIPIKRNVEKISAGINIAEQNAQTFSGINAFRKVYQAYKAIIPDKSELPKASKRVSVRLIFNQ